MWFAVILLMYPFSSSTRTSTKPNRLSMTTSPTSYASVVCYFPLHPSYINASRNHKNMPKKYVTPKTFRFTNPSRPSTCHFSSCRFQPFCRCYLPARRVVRLRLSTLNPITILPPVLRWASSYANFFLLNSVCRCIEPVVR